MKQLYSDLFPFALLVILILVGFIAFWSVADMVILGASLAVVLIPLHHRISEHTLPEISAAIVTFAVFLAGSIMVLFTYLVLSSNVVILTELFGTIGIWLNNPATNPLDFGIPVAKATLFDLLNKGTALFVDYQTTLLGNLSLIAFKIFVFFVSLFSLLRWGERLNMKFTSHVPEVLSGYFRKLSGVTVDTLYAIYIVQIAIAALTFFMAIPVFYLLGYGNVIFIPSSLLSVSLSPFSGHLSYSS